MGAAEILELIRAVIALAETVDLSRTFGAIREQASVEINGVKGLLIWDYIIWNEITFQDMEKKTIISLYRKFSDKDTKKRWNELVEEYGVKK